MINNYVCLYGTLVGIMKNKHKLWENTTKGILHWGFTKLFWLMKEIFKLEPQWEKKKKKIWAYIFHKWKNVQAVYLYIFSCILHIYLCMVYND